MENEISVGVKPVPNRQVPADDMEIIRGGYEAMHEDLAKATSDLAEVPKQTESAFYSGVGIGVGIGAFGSFAAGALAFVASHILLAENLTGVQEETLDRLEVVGNTLEDLECRNSTCSMSIPAVEELFTGLDRKFPATSIPPYPVFLGHCDFRLADAEWYLSTNMGYSYPCDENTCNFDLSKIRRVREKIEEALKTCR